MRDLRVMFIGDSFVAGVGDPAGLGWVGRAVAGAFAAGMPLTAYNLGVRRDTSADVLKRWQPEARARMQTEADCRVAFSFGTNDTTIEHGAQRVPPAESVANLSQALAEAAALELPVLVVGPPPVADDHDQTQRTGELSARFARVAEEQGVPYVDVIVPLRQFPAWSREARAGDGAHPADGGYSRLAELVMEPWLGWLSDGRPGVR